MRSIPRSFMGPVWDYPSAAPLSNRIAAACGLPTTLRAAQVFTSSCLPKLRQVNDATDAICKVTRALERERGVSLSECEDDSAKRGSPRPISGIATACLKCQISDIL